MKKQNKQLVGLILCFLVFFLAMAIMDYNVMHLRYDQEGIFRYWLSLALVVVAVGFVLSYLGYISGLPSKYIPAIFLTVILFFIAGLLDFFYFTLTLIHGQPYSFEYWSVQWRWFCGNGILPHWGWFEQILWSGACLCVLVFVWYKVLKKS